MTKTMKRVLLSICSCLLLLLCVNVFASTQTKSAKAATSQATSHTELTTETVDILEQASVRLTNIDDPYKGIRFTAAVNKIYFEGLGEGATVGILVKRGASDTLIEMGESGVLQYESQVWYDENANGMKYFTAVVYGIPVEDSGVSVTARAYAMAKDGEPEYSDKQSIRSMAYIADKALHDGYEAYSDYLVPYIDNAITSFALSESEVTVYADSTTGKTHKLTHVLEGEEKALTVTYASANENVCTVDPTGNITAVGYGQTTVTATCGSNKAEVVVNGTTSADRSMISNAQIVKVNEELTATYATDEAKLAEGAGAGINVTFGAKKWSGSSKDVLLQTDVDLVKDKEYVFEYSVKVNDSKFGGYKDTGFGYRTIVNLVDADGKYITTDGKSDGAQNIIDMSRYAGGTNQEYYRCSVRYTPTTDMENVRFVIRIVATTYTDEVDITLYKFKCFEAADTLGAKIVELTDSTGTMVAEQTADATLLAELNASAGILLKNDQAVVPAPTGTSGPMLQFNQALKSGKSYTVLYDVKKVAAEGEGASAFEGDFFNTRFSASNTTTVNKFTENTPIIALKQYYKRANNADKETINEYDIYHCANTFTATEDVPNLHMKINLYNTKAISYELVITNFRVVENDWATQVGDVYQLYGGDNTQGSHTQITDDATLLAGLNTNAGIRLYNENSATYSTGKGFEYKFNASLKADTEYNVYFDVKNISNSLGVNPTGAYYFSFVLQGHSLDWSKRTYSTQYSLGRLVSGIYMNSYEKLADGGDLYHCVRTITPQEDMDSLIMRVTLNGTMTHDAIIANVVVVESEKFAVSAYETYSAAPQIRVTADSSKLVNDASMGLEWLPSGNSWVTLGTGKTLDKGTYTLSCQVISFAGEENPLFLGAYNERKTSQQDNTTGGTKTVTDVTPVGSAYKVFNVEVEFTFDASAKLYLQAYNETGATGGFVITDLAVAAVEATE